MSDITITSLHQVKHERLGIGISILEDRVQIQAQSFPQNLKFETLLEIAELFDKAAELTKQRQVHNAQAPVPNVQPPTEEPQ